MTNEPVPTSRRPIGFWLKLVDRLIDEGLEATLERARMSRRHWQVLNVLHDGPASVTEADERVRPFLDGDEPSTAPVLDQLVDHGWAEACSDRFELTATGVARYERLLGEVSEYRRSLIAGVSDDDYSKTIGTLERMAVNLGWTG
jgi:DNA-binding PadR family transcriptional regulator